MGWTKLQFVLQAYEEIGYADYTYDLEPEELQAGGEKLDAMMGLWNGKGIRIGYSFSDNPQNIDLSTETNVPDWANEAVYLNLAKRIAPSKGKTLSRETIRDARTAYLTILGRSAQPNQMQFRREMPRGAGQKYWRRERDPFINRPQENLATGNDDIMNILAE